MSTAHPLGISRISNPVRQLNSEQKRERSRAFIVLQQRIAAGEITWAGATKLFDQFIDSQRELELVKLIENM